MFGIGLATVAGLMVVARPPIAFANADSRPPPPHLAIIAVQGQLDPTTVDFVSRSLHTAETDGSLVFLMQLDSTGSAKRTTRVAKLADELRKAKVPIAVWVGGDRASATNEAFALVRAADFSGVATRTRVGDAGAVQNGQDAQRAGRINVFAPTLGDFIVDIDGKRLDGHVVDTTKTVLGRNGYRQEPAVVATFAKPSFVARLLHSVTQPSVAYLLLVAGLLLIAFEFYALGVGIATAVGALFLVLAASGLAEQQTRIPAVVLMVLAVGAFCVDTQSGAATVWNVIGSGLFTVASLTLFPPGELSPITFVLVLGCVLAVAVLGLPATVRARCNMPAIEREWLIGEQGKITKVSGVEALVDIRGASWRASGDDLATGQLVLVDRTDGLILEVSRLITPTA